MNNIEVGGVNFVEMDNLLNKDSGLVHIGIGDQKVRGLGEFLDNDLADIVASILVLFVGIA